MIVDAITTIRRRDLLEAVCPNCGDTKMRTYHGNTVYCTLCSFSCNRWCTKAELLDLLYKEEDELNGAE